MSASEYNLDTLKANYLALVVTTTGVAANKLGEGQRVLFLDECDGKTFRGYTSLGEAVKLRRTDIGLVKVLGIDGKAVQHALRPSDGHLTIPTGDGDVDYGPWVKYEPKARKEKKKARYRGLSDNFCT
jgi:hypothetical protein